MSHQISSILTSRDFVILENQLQRRETFEGAWGLVRDKIGSATLVFPDDIPSDVVTIDSRVRFRAGEGETDERVIVVGSDDEDPATTLRLDSPRGLALLGARVGQSVEAVRDDGKTESLLVEAVLFQPEQRLMRAALKLVSSREPDMVPLEAKPHSSVAGSPDDWGDDPGPSAA